MHLKPEDVKEFMEIYKKKFGEEISYEEALESGMKLVNLMAIVYKPIRKDKQDKELN